ncbi:stress response translation initiation inhibitor YciH [Shewanella sp. OPT22]|nr:stress response translation initiation inhibitor YciH [Shewanella sp. OPT22]
MNSDNNVSLVYSTDTGRIKSDPVKASVPSSDGIVRIHKESKGRKGKGVSIIKGLGLEDKELKTLAQKLKKQCGCGGTVKDFNIEMQTDNRETLKGLLEKQGFIVKLAGG